MKKKKLFILIVIIFMTLAASAQTKVIAHRGYWTPAGSSQNSITSLMGANRIGVYGSEFDVHITVDGVVMINHDRTLPDGINIEKTTFKKIKKETLSNGEKLPTFKQYLHAGKKLKGTQLICEIKAHITNEGEDRCIDSVLKDVKKENMENQVEYISFSKNACQYLAQHAPTGTKISYLSNDLSPDQCKALGCTGIDFDETTYAKHPTYISDAHKLNMEVNVWTVDDLNQINEFIKAGVDFITTNKPVEALKLCK
ncbi:glycerophosphodiester phosphodiesterase [Prevotella cerevisiae]|jgi:glycerophosphoryl diester phosphodiesterase|uniref:Glycerophosphodiester phosphodiesterase n=1 Tax=Segatella cerevisiae TaxID=2053716 RepID=A0ABT1BX73_9BACT|nr:glycerophosphodiester phosphodiesterase family protein [Segatella cerevisiae]MCH3995116.1 glycerophosphodiester phosphodiesterase [Prevotella sp.]MCO6025666.1 glycerophosphodiester phosphodiesterase [Segatella cerevisiae]